MLAEIMGLVTTVSLVLQRLDRHRDRELKDDVYRDLVRLYEIVTEWDTAARNTQDALEAMGATPLALNEEDVYGIIPRIQKHAAKLKLAGRAVDQQEFAYLDIYAPRLRREFRVLKMSKSAALFDVEALIADEVARDPQEFRALVMRLGELLDQLQDAMERLRTVIVTLWPEAR